MSKMGLLLPRIYIYISNLGLGIFRNRVRQLPCEILFKFDFTVVMIRR